MLTPNYGCVGATDKFTCSDTVSVLYLSCFSFSWQSYNNYFHLTKGLVFPLLRPHLLLKRPQGRLGRLNLFTYSSRTLKPLHRSLTTYNNHSVVELLHRCIYDCHSNYILCVYAVSNDILNLKYVYSKM